MCGRFTLTETGDLVDAFSLVELPPDLERRFNIAPTQPAPVIRNRAPRTLEMLRWGLIPHWADDPGIGNRMINARGETLAEKPAFRDAFARRRCLVPADGFYEWKRQGKHKTPFWIHSATGKPLAFAGLWARWKAPDGQWLRSFTIVTGPPNRLVEPLHDRMPVIVQPEDHDRWLHPDPLPPDALADILRPAPEGMLALREVSPRVNSPANEGPACIEPAPGPVQGSLF
jgi:putative SOS response-associated peptidase YedK